MMEWILLDFGDLFAADWSDLKRKTNEANQKSGEDSGAPKNTWHYQRWHITYDESEFRRFGLPPSYTCTKLGNAIIKRRQKREKMILHSRGTRLD